MTDRFEELVGRSAKSAVFGPGVFWRQFGGLQILHERLGDTFPTFFIPLQVEPPPMGPGTRYTFNDEHFGVHAFLSISIEAPAGSIRLVSAYCLLDGACRAAAEHLLETTKDAASELGALDATFIIAACRPGIQGNFVCSGIKQVRLQHLVNAYQLWKITKPEDRETLKDRRCPLCRGKT